MKHGENMRSEYFVCVSTVCANLAYFYSGSPPFHFCLFPHFLNGFLELFVNICAFHFGSLLWTSWVIVSSLGNLRPFCRLFRTTIGYFLVNYIFWGHLGFWLLQNDPKWLGGQKKVWNSPRSADNGLKWPQIDPKIVQNDLPWGQKSTMTGFIREKLRFSKKEVAKCRQNNKPILGKPISGMARAFFIHPKLRKMEFWTFSFSSWTDAGPMPEHRLFDRLWKIAAFNS